MLNLKYMRYLGKTWHLGERSEPHMYLGFISVQVQLIVYLVIQGESKKSKDLENTFGGHNLSGVHGGRGNQPDLSKVIVIISPQNPQGSILSVVGIQNYESSLTINFASSVTKVFCFFSPNTLQIWHFLYPPTCIIVFQSFVFGLLQFSLNLSSSLQNSLSDFYVLNISEFCVSFQVTKKSSV